MLNKKVVSSTMESDHMDSDKLTTFSDGSSREIQATSDNFTNWGDKFFNASYKDSMTFVDTNRFGGSVTQGTNNNSNVFMGDGNFSLSRGHSDMVRVSDPKGNTFEQGTDIYSGKDLFDGLMSEYHGIGAHVNVSNADGSNAYASLNLNFGSSGPVGAPSISAVEFMPELFKSFGILLKDNGINLPKGHSDLAEKPIAYSAGAGYRQQQPEPVMATSGGHDGGNSW